LVSSLPARPSPFFRRVGIHIVTFEACSSFTRVTACTVARPPDVGLIARLRPRPFPGSDARQRSSPTNNDWSGSFPPGDLRLGGALKKSTDTSSPTWFFRKVFQLWEGRRGGVQQTRNGPLRNRYAEPFQFAMDPRGAPERVLAAHPANRMADLLRHHRPSRLSPLNLPAPEQAKAFPMPAEDRRSPVGRERDGTASPSRPRTAQPTRVDPPGSVSAAGRNVAERRVDGEGRGFPIATPHGFGTRRKETPRAPSREGRKGIEGGPTTSNLSITSEFTRTTVMQQLT